MREWIRVLIIVAPAVVRILVVLGTLAYLVYLGTTLPTT
jgi:hypothetical protein